MNTYSVISPTASLGLLSNGIVQSVSLLLAVDSFSASEFILIGIGGGSPELPQSGQIWPLGLA